MLAIQEVAILLRIPRCGWDDQENTCMDPVYVVGLTLDEARNP